MVQARAGMLIAAVSSNSLETARDVVQVITLDYEEEKKMRSKLKTHRRWKLSILLSLSSFALLLLTTSAQAQTQIIEPIDNGLLVLAQSRPTWSRSIRQSCSTASAP
jgi:ribosomal protein L18